MDSLKNPSESLNYVPWALFQITFILLLTIISTLLSGIVLFKPYFQKNIHLYKCHPLFIPFLSFVDPNANTLKNMETCLKDTIKPILKKELEKSVEKEFNDASGTTASAQESASVIAEHADILVNKNRDKMTSFLESFNIFRELFSYVIIKVNHIFLKIQSLIVIWYFMLITQINTVFIAISYLYRLSTYLAIWGAIFATNPFTSALSATLFTASAALKMSDAIASNKAFCCFSPNSLVRLADNSHVPIEMVRIGQKLSMNSTVLGTLKVLNQYEYLTYISPDLQLTPDHIVYNNSSWCRAEKYTSHKSPENPKYLYCLVTSHNIIPCIPVLCRDYEESNNTFFQTELSFSILKQLNSQIPIDAIQDTYEIGEINNCLLHTTLVRVLIDNSFVYKKITDVRIGDCVGEGVRENNTVLGIFTCETDLSTWGTLEMNGDASLISPRLILKHPTLTENVWNKSYNSKYFNNYSQRKSNKIIAYHLITSENSFVIQLPGLSLEADIHVRDFVQISDSTFQKKMDRIAINHVNEIM